MGDLALADDFALVDDYFENNNITNVEDSASSSDSTSSSLIPSTLSNNQERVLSILLVVSATLSTLGSASIVYKIVRDKQFSKPYHRTMLALSLSDVMASLTFGSYPFLMPKGVRIWTIGNSATCTMLGFFTQCSFVAIGYNCILSFYYLLAVRYNMKRKQFIRKYERPMHAINLCYFLITAAVGVAYRFYSAVDVGFGCWVNNWPPNCNLTGDCVSQQIAIVYAGIPVLFFFLAILVNHLVVFLYVRTIFRSLDKVYAAQEEQEALRLQKKETMSSWDEDNKKKNNNDTTTSNDDDKPNKKPQRKGLTAKEAIAARKITRQSELYEQKLQEVALQAFLYVASFLICYTPALGTRLVETFSYQYDDCQIYWLLVVTAITLPAQGFFNMFIYNRPYYIRIKEAHPNFTTLKAMRAAFLESKSLALSSWQSGIINPSYSSSLVGRPGARYYARRSKSTSGNRFSAVGGSLEVVMEEQESQIMSEDNNNEDVHSVDKGSSGEGGGTKRMMMIDNVILATTDIDSTSMNDTDISTELQDLLVAATADGAEDEDPPIVKSPVPPAPNVVNDAPAVDRIDISSEDHDPPIVESASPVSPITSGVVNDDDAPAEDRIDTIMDSNTDGTVSNSRELDTRGEIVRVIVKK